ncbi:SH3 domain-containing protein [Capnocytophaga leadbetteri]|uniref:SH3 domain-containing protein n=1 Tax=Capnocytophaga leadbetteri TaxID=327575 RepID=UPI0028ECEBC1|nr:SH3 domain-containing protein [Capnocytophaga leadbetteri]
MKHLFILFLLLTTNAFAQGPFGYYAVVKDKDGYVNIRAKESVKSKIVGTLPNNTLVYALFDTTEDETGEEIFFNWIAVDKGYVHKSRLKMIGEFPSIGKGKEKDTENSITIAGKGISVTLTKQPFDKTKHKITKKKHKEYSEYIIDGKRAQGLDGGLFLPEDHYKSITVTINGKDVPIPKSAYDDLYEVAMYTDNNAVYYDKEEDTIYIIAHNGSGAFSYEVCWQIVKGEYKTRIIGEPF